MRNIWLIARREVKLYFISPVAYAVAFLVLLVLGIIFYGNIVYAANANYAPGVDIVLSPMVTLFLFSIPAITMRTLADEQKSGTLELLLTAPIRDWELIVGKWLGSFIFVAIIIAVTLIYPYAINQMVKPSIDQGTVLSGYLGLLLMTGSFTAIGVFASSLYSNQIAAFFTSLGILMAFWLIGLPSQALGGSGSAILQYLTITSHFSNSFLQGIIDLKDVLYYISLIALALFLGASSVESRRWR